MSSSEKVTTTHNRVRRMTRRLLTRMFQAPPILYSSPASGDAPYFNRASPDSRKQWCPHFKRSCAVQAPPTDKCEGGFASRFFGCHLCHDRVVKEENGVELTPPSSLSVHDAPWSTTPSTTQSTLVQSRDWPDAKKDDSFPTTVHKMDPSKIQVIMCKWCCTVQEVSNQCTLCSRQFADRFCALCGLWDSSDMFHCTKCECCQSRNVVHCDHCGMCAKPDHRCLQRRVTNKNVSSVCPECGVFVRGTKDDCRVSECGHKFHEDCWQTATMRDYRCPEASCKASMMVMTEMFASIDRQLAREAEQNDLLMCTPGSSGSRRRQEKRSIIRCFDCTEHSSAVKHDVYHKCAICGSYNTETV